MSIDLDRSLHLLGSPEEPAALSALDDAVLARLRRERDGRGPGGAALACAAAVGAVLLGLVAANPTASASASPLGADMALAPSTLLAGR